MWPASQISHNLLRKYASQLAQPDSHNKVQPATSLIDFLGAKTARQNIEWWSRQPVFKSSQACFGNLDSAWLSKDRLILRGWIFHRSEKIKILQLIVRGIKARVLITADQRSDVATAFPAEPYAHTCGFYLAIDWRNKQINKLAPGFLYQTVSTSGFGNFNSVEINPV